MQGDQKFDEDNLEELGKNYQDHGNPDEMDKTRNMRDIEYCRKVQSRKPPMTDERSIALQKLFRNFPK